MQHRLGLRHRGATQLRLHPGDQRRDQVGLPGRPRRGCWSRHRRPARGRAGAGGRRGRRRWSPRRGRWSRGRRCRAGSRSRAAAGGGAPGSPSVATSGAEKPIRAPIVGRDRLARPRCGRPGQPLPMSCSSAATSSRSGRSTSWVSSAAAAAASTRCRSTVYRCHGWRCGSDRTRSHSGSSRDEQALLVQLLEDRHGGAAAGEQPQERPAHLRRPRLGHRRAVHREHLERVRREQQVRAGRGGGRAEQQAGVGGGPGVAGEHDLVALADHALGQRLAPHPPVAAAGAPDERGLHPPPGLVGDEGQPPAGQADLAQQRVLVGQPERDRHRPLLLADQHVAAGGRCAGGARRARRAAGRRPPRPRRSVRRRAGRPRPRAAPGPRAGRRRPP